jgi:hypothetical protein
MMPPHPEDMQGAATGAHYADFLLAACCEGWVSSASSSPPSASLPCQVYSQPHDPRTRIAKFNGTDT